VPNLNKMDTDGLADLFEQEFHAEAQLFRAPGRVNLIGEHTDYNDGFVLPSAIGFYTHVAASPRDDHKLVLRSTEYSGTFEFDVSNLPLQKQGTWCDYVLGVAQQFTQKCGHLLGANLLVRGKVPVGSGLSSSAALEVASALALQSLNESELPLKQIAQLCQRAENEFVGARVGIMDQFVSCFGKEGRAVLIDCRSLDYELVPVPADLRFVICNTMVKHENSGGEYNRRREQCELGVHLLSKVYPAITALRDVSADQLTAHESELPPLVYRRCLHVVRENERTLQVARLLESGDLASVGTLMHASHESLRDLYEVSCSELDAMVEAAEGLPGYIGGRMTGGGFGGCTINLVEGDKAQTFADAITARYKGRTGVDADVYLCSAADGAGAETRKAAV
jgi:galactokinase